MVMTLFLSDDDDDDDLLSRRGGGGGIGCVYQVLKLCTSVSLTLCI